MENLPKKIVDSFEEGQISIKEKPGNLMALQEICAQRKQLSKIPRENLVFLELPNRKLPYSVGACPAISLVNTPEPWWRLQQQLKKECRKADNNVHPECQPTAMKHDETHFTAIINHINTIMTDPLMLKSILHALLKSQVDCRLAQKLKSRWLELCILERHQWRSLLMVSCQLAKKKSPYSGISRSEVIRFQDMKKKAITKNSNGIRIHLNISPETVYRYTMAISPIQEDINMEGIYESHCWCSAPIYVPWRWPDVLKSKVRSWGQTEKSLWKGALSCHHF